jgi:hypothetical protein
MLLSDADVEGREAFLLEAIALAQESDHLIGRFAARQASKAGHDGDLQVGEPAGEVVVQRMQGHVGVAFNHSLSFTNDIIDGVHGQRVRDDTAWTPTSNGAASD